MPPQTLTSSSFLATLTNKMQSRDDPINRSTRPLLERRPQPQVVSTASSTSSSQNSSPSVIKSMKNFNSCETNKTSNKKLLLTGGFNDFHAIPKQYDSLSSIHFQFPYGSPPSPTVRDIDFKFSDENHQPLYNNQQHNPMKNPSIVTNRKLIANNNNNHNQIKKQQRKYNSIDNNEQQHQHVNVRNYNNHYNQNNQSNNDITVIPTTNALDCNDFSWRPVPPPRNFNNLSTTSPPQQHFNSHLDCVDANVDNTVAAAAAGVGKNAEGGPFVFGVHNQMFETNNKNTVIVARNKYSLSDNDANNTQQHQQQQYNNKQSPNSSQNTSSSSTKTTEDNRQCLVPEKKKKSKRTKKDKNDNQKRNSKASAIKCVLIGDGAVGKTNLIVSYIQDRFIPEYQPTVFDKFNVEVKVDGKPFWLTLCDTAGQDALDPLRQLCYPGSHVYLLCFSVIKPETFRSIEEKWIPEVSKLGGTLLLVGTQSDLRSDLTTIAHLQARSEKPVSISDAWDLARRIGAKYIESSSYSKDRIKEVFDTAIWDALLPLQQQYKSAPLWKRIFCLV